MHNYVPQWVSNFAYLLFGDKQVVFSGFIWASFTENICMLWLVKWVDEWAVRPNKKLLWAVKQMQWAERCYKALSIAEENRNAMIILCGFITVKSLNPLFKILISASLNLKSQNLSQQKIIMQETKWLHNIYCFLCCLRKQTFMSCLTKLLDFKNDCPW